VRWQAVVVAALCWFGLAGSVRSAETPPQQKLPPTVERVGREIQAQWLLWLKAYYQRDPQEAAVALDGLVTQSRQLGMHRLPDLSIAAAVSAVRAAREGDAVRATWALEAAEVLDPERPESAFAGARVAWLQHDWVKAVGRFVSGYERALRLDRTRAVLLSSVLVLFILLELMLRAAQLSGALMRLVPASWPSWVRGLGLLLVLLWPVVVHFGMFWLLLYWSALLWGFVGWRERSVFLALWAWLLVTPAGLNLVQSRVEFMRTPSSRALADVAAERLSGTFFSDFAALREGSPRQPELTAVSADLERRMGEWDTARRLYHLVLDSDPDNYGALNNLGVYHYRVSETGAARELFQRAIKVDGERPSGHFNESQVYSDAYLFSDAERELARARELNAGLVSQWISQSGWDRVVAVDDGLGRVDQLQTLRWRRWRQSHDGFLAGLSAAIPIWSLALGCWLLLAYGADVGLRRLEKGRVGMARPGAGTASSPSWIRRLPAADHLMAGSGAVGFIVLMLPSALLALWVMRPIPLSVPLGFQPGLSWSLWLSTAGSLFYALYLWRKWVH
jgi:tetratricopeptide (TPR) repeat protein